GPSITLVGTFWCKNKPVFLERLCCRVTRSKDNATHTFDWDQIRNTSTDGGTRDGAIATGFLLQPTAPASRLVTFTVGSIRRDHVEAATAVQRAWFAFAESQMREKLPASDQAQLGAFLDHPDVKAGL